jgi:hypothetical protein
LASADRASANGAAGARERDPAGRDQAERKKHQAAGFMNRIGEPDRADEFDDMSVEEYAEHRGFEAGLNAQLDEIQAEEESRSKSTSAARGLRRVQVRSDNQSQPLSPVYLP